MIFIYRILFLPALLILGPYYLLRMRKRGGYRNHFEQRFGRVPSPEKRIPANTSGFRRSA